MYIYTEALVFAPNKLRQEHIVFLTSKTFALVEVLSHIIVRHTDIQQRA